MPRDLEEGALRINLGCGARWSSAWSNLDGGPWVKRQWLRSIRVLRRLPVVDRVLPARLRQYPRDIVIWNMRRVPLPYPTRAASVIFSQYSFEYMRPEEVRACLKDCRRILRPGGLIRLAQADISGIVARYLADSDVGASPMAIDRAARFLASAASEHTRLSVRLLYAGGHQQLFDAPSLEWMLTEAGFTDIRFVNIHEGECPDLEVLEAEFEPVPMIRVEARTP